MNEPTKELEYKVLLEEVDSYINSIGKKLYPILQQLPPSVEQGAEGYGNELLNDLKRLVNRLQELDSQIRL